MELNFGLIWLLDGCLKSITDKLDLKQTKLRYFGFQIFGLEILMRCFKKQKNC